MNSHPIVVAAFRSAILAVALATASPALAQWTRVTDLPASDVFTLSTRGDTIVAGLRKVAYVSTDAGASWQPSSEIGAAVLQVRAALMRNGRLYAGTAGQGVFVSDDLGQTWQAFNQGLVGGIFNTQLDIADLQIRGDSLCAATLGAGVYVRKLTGASTWSHFGDEFELNQASNVRALAVGGQRLLAAAGGNGTTFFRDPGDADWTLSWLDNVGLRPGLQASSALWTGNSWMVLAAGGRGLFRSESGQEPWAFLNFGLGVLNFSALAADGPHVFAALNVVNNSVIERSDDDGATWQFSEVLPGVFVYRMVTSGADLFAGRADGLWHRSTGTVSVPIRPETAGVRFALIGPQPVADDVRLHFELPEAATVTIDFFDVSGRRAAGSLRESWSAGAHDVSWSARTLSPGVYEARLSTGAVQKAVRVVHVR